MCGADGVSTSVAITIGEYFTGFTAFTGISTGGSEITLTFSGATSEADPVFKLGDAAVQVLSFNAATGVTNLRLPATTAGNQVFSFARKASLSYSEAGKFPWVDYSTKFVTAAPAWSVSSLSVSG